VFLNISTVPLKGNVLDAIEVKISFIFVTKAEFEMYRFNVNFPVYNPKLFAREWR
jgi:hypothetical protein